LLIESFNGKPQESSPDFAYACGLPLNENAQDSTTVNAQLPLKARWRSPMLTAGGVFKVSPAAHGIRQQVGKCLGNCGRFACHSE